MSGTPMGDKLGVGGGGPQQSPSMQSHADPLASLTGSPMGMSGGGMGNASPAPAPVPATPNPIAQGAQQGATAGLTAGLGAGDAAAAASRASAIPGGGSADALSGMMQGIGDHNRASIQQKIDMIKKMMGGG